MPAQSLFPTLPSLYSIFHAADVRRVVWYCGMLSSIASPERLHLCACRVTKLSHWLSADLHRVGSSRGRGNRAAAWFADYLKDISDQDIRSLVLEGGIKGWVGKKGEYLQYVQDYDESKW